jgi:nucleoside-diphosphate-sugar epimerase
MVHSNDVAQAIIKLFATWPAARQCYNLCSPKRVLKRNFYQTAAMALGLAPETIAFADTELGLEPARQVNSQAITSDTSFTYQFYDASAALAYC